MVIRLPQCAPCRTIAVWSAVLSIPLICIGWPAGYDSAAAYPAFWLSVTGVLSFTATIIRRVYQPRGLSEAIVETGVAAFAIIVLCGLVFGAVGVITPTAYAVVAAILLGS